MINKRYIIAELMNAGLDEETSVKIFDYNLLDTSEIDELDDEVIANLLEALAEIESENNNQR